MGLVEQYSTVWNKWTDNARRFPDKDAIIHWRAGEEPFRWTFKTLMETANLFSNLLWEKGIRPNDICALVIRHNPYFYPLYIGISGLGAIPAVLAYPNPRLHPDKFRQGLEGMSQRSGLDYIFTERSLEEIVSPLVTKEGSTIKGLHFPLEYLDELKNTKAETLPEITEVRESITSADPVLLQHSSGTTGLQKPVLLSHRAVLQHVENYFDSIQLNENDKIISWLPLYHDMGLIAAYHLPLAYGIPAVQIDPFEWVIAPVLLLEAFHKERGTVCWLPNFAYNFLADRVPDDEIEGFSLETMKLVINCSEPVRDASHDKFYQRFKSYGFKESALSACYAMAETTFAVTQTPINEPVKKVAVVRDELSAGNVIFSDGTQPERVCVSSGTVIKGCDVRIIDEKGNNLPDGKVGEIVIASVSMFDGYRNYPEKTEAALKDGWFYSGDFGFMLNGHCYVIGRKKDIIIVAGKNIYPEDIEDAVGSVDGIIPGRVIAFGEDNPDLGTEEISVIAESKIDDETGQKAIRKKIIEIGMSMDVTISHIYIVPPRWLIKSSAGKPSRKANKERILAERKEA